MKLKEKFEALQKEFQEKFLNKEFEIVSNRVSYDVLHIDFKIDGIDFSIGRDVKSKYPTIYDYGCPIRLDISKSEDLKNVANEIFDNHLKDVKKHKIEILKKELAELEA